MQHRIFLVALVAAVFFRPTAAQEPDAESPMVGYEVWFPPGSPAPITRRLGSAIRGREFKICWSIALVGVGIRRGTRFSRRACAILTLAVPRRDVQFLSRGIQSPCFRLGVLRVSCYVEVHVQC